MESETADTEVESSLVKTIKCNLGIGAIVEVVVRFATGQTLIVQNTGNAK